MNYTFKLHCLRKGPDYNNVTEDIIRQACFHPVDENRNFSLEDMTIYAKPVQGGNSTRLWINPARDGKGLLVFDPPNKPMMVTWNGGPLLPHEVPGVIMQIDSILLPHSYFITREQMFQGALYFWKHQTMDPSLQWTDLDYSDDKDYDPDQDNTSLQLFRFTTPSDR